MRAYVNKTGLKVKSQFDKSSINKEERGKGRRGIREDPFCAN